MRSIGAPGIAAVGVLPEGTLLANILRGRAYDIEVNQYSVPNPQQEFGILYVKNQTSVALSVYVDRLFLSVGNVQGKPKSDFFSFTMIKTPDLTSPFIVKGTKLNIRNRHIGYPSTGTVLAIGPTTGEQHNFTGGDPVWIQELSTDFPIYIYPFIVNLMIASNEAVAISITLPNGIQKATVNIAAQIYTIPATPNMD